MARNTARINEIREILRSGVVETEIDGQRVKYNHDSLRLELLKLERADTPSRRPVAASLNLGGF